MYIKHCYRDGRKFIAVSEESPFYPDGKGGQLGDRGKIGSVQVLSVFEQDEMTYHVVPAYIEPGEYEAEIDQNRRRDIAAQHTAQHILSAAFLRVAEIQTVGFHMGENVSTVDLNVPFLTEEALSEAENSANDVIRRCLTVNIEYLKRNEIDLSKLRKPLSDKIKEPVRIISIGDYDVSACSGFHVSNTGEIGIVKIVDTEKVKGNLTRIYYMAAERALKNYRNAIKTLKKLSVLLTSSTHEMSSRVESLLAKVKHLSSRQKALSEDLAREITRSAAPLEICGFSVLVYEGHEEVSSALPKYSSADIVVCAVEGGYTIATTEKINCGRLVKTMKQRLKNSSGGGGSRRGMLKTSSDSSTVLNILRSVLCEMGGSLK